MKVTCPSCGSRFASWSAPTKAQSKQPLLLKCGHTFCESCLGQKTRRISSSHLHHAQVTCPTCKNVTLLENGIKDLPVNIYLSAYIEISQRGKLDQHLEHGVGQFVPSTKFQRPFSEVDIKESKCKMCVAKNATCNCAECDSMLCSACFAKVHSMSAAIKHHKPIPIPTTSQADTNNEGEPKCAEHNRILEYFCEDDSLSICSRCYIVGVHQNHAIISIEEKNKHVLEDIANELPKARLVLQNLNKVDKKIVLAVPNAKTETKSLIESINQSFLKLHSLIQAREMEIINEVYSAYKSHLVSIDQQRETLDKFRSELDDAIRKSNKLFENNALLLDGHALFETLRKAKTTPCVVLKTNAPETESLQWHETNEGDLMAIISAYGNISGTLPQKLEFKTIDEGSEHTEDDDKMSVHSLGSESSVQSLGVTVSVLKNVASVDNGKDVVIESEDVHADLEIPKDHKDTALERIMLPVIKGPAQTVVVTHIRSPNTFCIQLVCNKRQLKTLSHNINTWCNRNASAKHIPLSFDKGTLLLARYSADKQWYRAKVLNVEKPTVEKDDNLKVHVKYIDFGNDELLPVKELRTMQARFMRYPIFSVQCSLFDIAPFEEDQPWSLESVKEFHRMTQNQVLMMTALSMQGSVFEVDLLCIPMSDALDDNYTSVKDILIFLGLARFRTFSDAAMNTSAPPSYPKVDFIKPTSVQNGSTLDIILTDVTSPWDVHLVCVGEEHDYYLTMHEEMQQMYNKDLCNIYSMFYPQVGMVCAARGCNDEWHRAKVISSPVNKQVTVNLVDLGTTQSVHYNHLKKLHSSFIKLPVQAIHCRLVDICPIAGPTNEWAEEAILWCCTNLTGASGQARFIRYGQETQVVLWLESSVSLHGPQSINSILVEKGFAKSTGPSSVSGAKESQSSPSHIMHRDGDYSLRGGDFKEITDLDSMTQKLSETSISATKSKKKITKPGSEQPIKNKIKSKESPPTIYKPKTNKKTVSKPQKVHKVPTSTEEKQRIQQEINKAMSSDGLPPSETVYIEVLVCYYVSPSEFYVQVLDTQEDLIKLMKDMQTTFTKSESSPSRSWSVNEYCAAKYSTDGLWYRANISSKISDAEYQVEYVDYGNTDIVNISDLRRLPPDFGNRIPCAAARCHLADLLPAGSMDITKWSRTAIEFMASLLKDRKLYIKQEGDPTEIGLPVDLIMEEEIPETAFEPSIQTYHSVRREVIKNGLAMPCKKQSVPSSPDTPGNNPFMRFLLKSEDNSDSGQVGQDCSRDLNKNSSLPIITQDNLQAVVEACLNEISENLDQHQIITVPPYPLPEKGVEITVVPTYVGMEGIIYVQPLIWEGKCVHLSHELQRIYGHVSPKVVTEWQVGQMCVALFPDDGLWYRALTQEMKDGRIKVHYIDFGNSAWVRTDQLRVMLPAFAKEHALAYCCNLDDLEPISPTKVWSEEVLDYIHKLIVNQTCIIIVSEADEGSSLKIQLFKDDISLCEDLIKRSLAVSPLGMKTLCEQSYLTGQVLANENPYHQLEVGDVGDTFRAIMVHIELPNVIYLQRGLQIEPEETNFVKAFEVAEINNSISEFVDMAERLKSCRSMPMTHLPDVGLMCAAKFSADDQVYRALCVQCFPETDSCLMIYVDYGTSEVVPRSRIKLLPSEFWSVPAQAIRCHISLSSVTESARQLSHHSFVGIVSCVTERALMARILHKNPLTVELLVEDDGQWRVPYKHIFENDMEKSSSIEVLMNDLKDKTAVDANISLHGLEEQKKFRESSDDDYSDDVGISTTREKVVSEAEEESDNDDDDDNVDWVAVAAKLVEKTLDCGSVEEPTEEVGKSDSSVKESTEEVGKCDSSVKESDIKSNTVAGGTAV